MNLVGELVHRPHPAHPDRQPPCEKYEDEELAKEMLEVCRHVGRITDEVQDEVMKSRMLPIDSVFSRFPAWCATSRSRREADRLHRRGRRHGARPVGIRVIGDPLVHLLRNAVDHGMETLERRRAAGKPETGTVRLTAQHVENQIVIAIEDDGPGIDEAKVKAKPSRRG